MKKGFNISEAFSSQNNQLKNIPIEQLIYNDDYERYEGEQYEDMVESIKKNGILQPLLVHSEGNNTYKIMAGNNRRFCGEAAGLKTCPCIVKEGLTPDEVQMYIDETNIYQRGFSNLKISKQAGVLGRRYKAMFNETKLKMIQSEIAAMNGETFEEEDSDVGKNRITRASEEYGLGKTTVSRLLRINELTDELKALVDAGIIRFRAAVAISYLSKEQQNVINETIKNFSLTSFDIKKADYLKQLNKNDELTDERIVDILLGKEAVKQREDMQIPNKAPEPVTQPVEDDVKFRFTDDEPLDDDEEEEENNGDEFTFGNAPIDDDEESYGEKPPLAELIAASANKKEKEHPPISREEREEKAAAREERKELSNAVFVRKSIIDKYFAPNSSEDEIMATIERALDYYFKQFAD